MRWVLSCFCMLSLLGTSRAEQRFESFDRDPGWDASPKPFPASGNHSSGLWLQQRTRRMRVAHAGKWVAAYNPPPKRPILRFP